MEIEPTPLVLLKVPLTMEWPPFKIPIKTQKLVMLSFQNQRTPKSVTPTLSVNSTLLSPPPSLRCKTSSVSPARPTPHSASQTCSAPASPRADCMCSRDPTPYSCLAASAVAPSAAHLHCASAKKLGDGPCKGTARDSPYLRYLQYCCHFLGTWCHTADAADGHDSAPQSFQSCET